MKRRGERMKSQPLFSRPILLFILILALTGQACSISLLEWPIFPTPGGPTNPTPGGPTATPPPRAQMTFTVRIPDPLPANEILALSVLDEVTGLSLNAVDYQLTAVDTITYTATLAIPDKAIIKYRYIRRGASQIVEDTNTDGLIRYRLVYVNGPTQITDTVSSWSDKPAHTLSGNISGTVLNASTGTPLPDIMVTAGGVQVQTDSAGRFQLTGLRGGGHNRSEERRVG